MYFLENFANWICSQPTESFGLIYKSECSQPYTDQIYIQSILSAEMVRTLGGYKPPGPTNFLVHREYPNVIDPENADVDTGQQEGTPADGSILLRLELLDPENKDTYNKLMELIRKAAQQITPNIVLGYLITRNKITDNGKGSFTLSFVERKNVFFNKHIYYDKADEDNISRSSEYYEYNYEGPLFSPNCDGITSGCSDNASKLCLMGTDVGRICPSDCPKDCITWSNYNGIANMPIFISQNVSGTVIKSMDSQQMTNYTELYNVNQPWSDLNCLLNCMGTPMCVGYQWDQNIGKCTLYSDMKVIPGTEADETVLIRWMCDNQVECSFEYMMEGRTKGTSSNLGYFQFQPDPECGGTYSCSTKRVQNTTYSYCTFIIDNGVVIDMCNKNVKNPVKYAIVDTINGFGFNMDGDTFTFKTTKNIAGYEVGLEETSPWNGKDVFFDPAYIRNGKQTYRIKMSGKNKVLVAGQGARKDYTSPSWYNPNLPYTAFWCAIENNNLITNTDPKYLCDTWEIEIDNSHPTRFRIIMSKENMPSFVLALNHENLKVASTEYWDSFMPYEVGPYLEEVVNLYEYDCGYFTIQSVEFSTSDGTCDKSEPVIEVLGGGNLSLSKFNINNCRGQASYDIVHNLLGWGLGADSDNKLIFIERNNRYYDYQEFPVWNGKDVYIKYLQTDDGEQPVWRIVMPGKNSNDKILVCVWGCRYPGSDECIDEGFLPIWTEVDSYGRVINIPEDKVFDGWNIQKEPAYSDSKQQDTFRIYMNNYKYLEPRFPRDRNFIAPKRNLTVSESLTFVNRLPYKTDAEIRYQKGDNPETELFSFRPKVFPKGTATRSQ